MHIIIGVATLKISASDWMFIILQWRLWLSSVRSSVSTAILSFFLLFFAQGYVCLLGNL
jgi:hypothetical protein